jgi:signal transduction histidine kinase
MTCIIAVCGVNQLIVTSFARTEVYKIFNAKSLRQYWLWGAETNDKATPEELKSQLRDAIYIARSNEILIFTKQHSDGEVKDYAQDIHDFLPGAKIIEQRPLLGGTPNIKQLVVNFQNENWEVSRLVTHTRTIVSAVKQAAIERSYQALLEVRGNTMKSTAPIILVLFSLCALFITKKILQPTRRIQQSLHKLDSSDLNFRLSADKEDQEFVEFIHVFNGMLARLENSFMQASRFSSDAAHELRTPLTIVQGYMERAIYESEPGSKTQIQLTLIADEIQRLTSITQKLLFLSQADAGRLRLDRKPFNVSDFLDELASDIEIYSPEIEVRRDIERKIYFNTDQALFQQLLNNLLNNAMKYNVPDGWIKISAHVKDQNLHISFANPSFPIAEATREQVFQRFYRGDTAHNRKIDGIGLGLSLCREIAIANHGSLSFEVDSHNIVTVTFCAPLANH